MIETSRRSFITSLISLAVTAPAIVRASIMPVKVIDPREEMIALLRARLDEAYRITQEQMVQSLYGDLPLRAICNGYEFAASGKDQTVFFWKAATVELPI